MDHLFDEFSKSLAESVPRRESLRRLGTVLAGAVLTPLGLGTAWAGGYRQPRRDPCKEFCKCRNAAKQNQCLAACKKCNGNTARLAGSCGSYTCCAVASCRGVCSSLSSDPNCGACGNDCRAFGETCCRSYCADLAGDVDNCGGCGDQCPEPPPGESVACVAGSCVYDCAPGYADCDGTCTPVNWDPDNCGACGNVCVEPAPYCNGGTCSECPNPLVNCGGVCTDTSYNNGNCGACGVVCPSDTTCVGGWCEYTQPCTPDNPYYPNC